MDGSAMPTQARKRVTSSMDETAVRPLVLITRAIKALGPNKQLLAWKTKSNIQSRFLQMCWTPYGQINSPKRDVSHKSDQAIGYRLPGSQLQRYTFTTLLSRT